MNGQNALISSAQYYMFHFVISSVIIGQRCFILSGFFFVFFFIRWPWPNSTSDLDLIALTLSSWGSGQGSLPACRSPIDPWPRCPAASRCHGNSPACSAARTRCCQATVTSRTRHAAARCCPHARRSERKLVSPGSAPAQGQGYISEGQSP